MNLERMGDYLTVRDILEIKQIGYKEAPRYLVSYIGIS